MGNSRPRFGEQTPPPKRVKGTTNTSPHAALVRPYNKGEVNSAESLIRSVVAHKSSPDNSPNRRSRRTGSGASTPVNRGLNEIEKGLQLVDPNASPPRHYSSPEGSPSRRRQYKATPVKPKSRSPPPKRRNAGPSRRNFVVPDDVDETSEEEEEEGFQKEAPPPSQHTRSVSALEPAAPPPSPALHLFREDDQSPTNARETTPTAFELPPTPTHRNPPGLRLFNSDEDSNSPVLLRRAPTAPEHQTTPTKFKQAPFQLPPLLNWNKPTFGPNPKSKPSAQASSLATSGSNPKPNKAFGQKPNSARPTRQLAPTTSAVKTSFRRQPPNFPTGKRPTTSAITAVFGDNFPSPSEPPTPSTPATPHTPLGEMSHAASSMGVTMPNQTRSLRACMVCSIIQPHQVFLQKGCPNCEPVLQLQGSNDNINECTSSNYNGIIAVMSPEGSWVARYHRLDGYVKGMYAVQVVGNLPEEVVEQVRASGMRFVKRDGAKEDEMEME